MDPVMGLDRLAAFPLSPTDDRVLLGFSFLGTTLRRVGPSDGLQVVTDRRFADSFALT